jgi:16S rRNA (uracil1498-N3)-methyltransferase
MRRIHVPKLRVGRFALAEAQAHHARDVLRLGEGATVELFDAAGNTAEAAIVGCSSQELIVEVKAIQAAPAARLSWTIASAIPKGDRAEWMVEKLSELGCARLVPLMTARSVVHPQGQGKRSRWQRIAAEAAKQSRRVGVMEIGELIEVKKFLEAAGPPAWYLSTDPSALPIKEAVAGVQHPASLTLLIGPEGGWTDEEIGQFNAKGLTGVSLGPTILRVETAAIVAGALVSALLV